VHLARTSRRLPVWISSGCLVLALFVFAWGLGYKLSLYDPPQSTSHQIPQAKLLSKNEQGSIAKTPLTGQIKTSIMKASLLLADVLFAFFLSLSLFGVPASCHRERDAELPWLSRHLAGLNFFFVLPPPFLA
jgi:type VI protein secretion system component VasF